MLKDRHRRSLTRRYVEERKTEEGGPPHVLSTTRYTFSTVFLGELDTLKYDRHLVEKMTTLSYSESDEFGKIDPEE